MGVRPPRFMPHGSRTKRERDKDHDHRRGSAADRGYDSRWSKAAKGHRRRSPLCRYCELEGRVTPAELVDHLYPWRRFGRDIFWVTLFWVSSCTACHSGFKQQVERQGSRALDALARRFDLPTLSEYQKAQGGVGGVNP